MATASRLVPKTTRPIMLCFPILVIALATVNTPVLADQVYHSSPPSTLVIYEHLDPTPPNQTYLEVATPSGNLASFGEFGSIGLLSAILREGESNDSPALGVVYGPVFYELDSYLFGTVTFVLSTESFSGSISAQGVLISPGNGELAITGGTGDFRWARGYVDISFVAENPHDRVLKDVFYIKYD